MKPRIALPADTFTEATNIINQRNAAYAPQPVIQAITRAGGIPVIFPTIDPADVPAYLDLFDGLLLLGGFDVDPTLYGEEPDMLLGETYRKRDLFEIELVKQSIAAGKAILGICRGQQVVNVALGGTLYQDLSYDKDAYIQHSQRAAGNLPTHHINVVSDSVLYDLLGARPFVNSRHHEAVKDTAPGLRVIATADDNVIEALQSENNDQILTVQWHPENMQKHDPSMKSIFTDLIKRSANVAAQQTLHD
ncbi:MAG TPA: gamma-glutamyl-gamma-aminobutyrate hydrolase [Lactobacillus sp.]|nr:gamma-glutamyl-gamma-aminobutyrate hydrolase [Lactobacillus sp.]